MKEVILVFLLSLLVVSCGITGTTVMEDAVECEKVSYSEMEEYVKTVYFTELEEYVEEECLGGVCEDVVKFREVEKTREIVDERPVVKWKEVCE